jgi:octaprenyl-diphosphate synthase
LLLAMQRCTNAERDLIRSAIENGEVHGLAEIAAIVERTGSLDATRRAARDEADKAAATLISLPESKAKTALLEFCVRSVDRTS